MAKRPYVECPRDDAFRDMLWELWLRFGEQEPPGIRRGWLFPDWGPVDDVVLDALRQPWGGLAQGRSPKGAPGPGPHLDRGEGLAVKGESGAAEGAESGKHPCSFESEESKEESDSGSDSPEEE